MGLIMTVSPPQDETHGGYLQESQHMAHISGSILNGNPAHGSRQDNYQNHRTGQIRGMFGWTP